MRRIIFHGRGGQGVVTSAQIIVDVIIEQGAYAQFLPSFGVERKGSPVHGYLRQSDEPIRINSQIYHSNMFVVYDESLLKLEQTFKGIEDNAVLLVNTFRNLEELNKEYNLPKEIKTIYAVDATNIAMETIGVDIPNTTMLGAYAKAIGEVDWNLLKEKIIATFGEANGKAAEVGYDNVHCLTEEVSING